MTPIAGMLPLQVKAVPIGERVDSQDDEAMASADFTALLQTALTEHKSGSAISPEEESDTSEGGQIHPKESGEEVHWSANESAPVFVATLASEYQPGGEKYLQPLVPSTVVLATATDSTVVAEPNSATDPATATNVAPDAEMETAPDSAPDAAVTPTHVPKPTSSVEPSVSTSSNVSALATTGTVHTDPLDPEHTTDDGETAVAHTVGADQSAAPQLRSATQPHSVTPSYAETELPDVPPPPTDVAENSASDGPGPGVPSASAPAIISSVVAPQASPVVTAPAVEPPAVPPPAVAPQSSLAAAAPAAAIPASPTASPPVMLSPQLAPPVHQLVSKGDGSHTLTLRVSPERLGPVTVQAHIQGEKIKIELFSAMEMGRDALRSVLSDLRRDLAGLGMSTGTTVLTVSDADSPTTQSQSQQSRTAEQHAWQWARQGTPEERLRDESRSDPQGAPAVPAPMTDHPTHRIQGESLDLFA